MSPSLLNAASLTLVCAVIASLAAPALHFEPAARDEAPAAMADRLADLYMDLITPGPGDGASAPRPLPPVELVRRLARTDGRAPAHGTEIAALTGQDPLTVRR